MDTKVLLVALIGIIASLIMQVIKRRNAGPLENNVVSFAVAALAALLLPRIDALAVDTSTVNTIAGAAVVSFAWHGITGDLRPMKALRLGLLDQLMEMLGAAFNAGSSGPPKPAGP